MAEYLHPGVYIEEIERGPRPIEGVPTSTAAFIGEAERGPVKPRLVTSYKEFQRWFGGVFGDSKFLPYAVNGFFENGGRRLFVGRIVGEQAKAAAATVDAYTVRAVGAGAWGNRVWACITPSSTKRIGADGKPAPVGFRLQLAYWRSVPEGGLFNPFTAENRNRLPRPSLSEDYDDLVLDEGSPDFYQKRLLDSSALAMLERDPGAPPALPGSLDKALDGGDEDAGGLGTDDYLGQAAGNRSQDQGLAALALDPYREVSLVYSPAASPDVAKAIIAHCESTRFRFAVIDSEKTVGNLADLEPRSLITDTQYGAYYFPWISVADPQTGARKVVPPGGHVLGVYARTDAERGVFKAPANEILRGAIELAADITDAQQDQLNPRGVNVTRSFAGRGIRVWGARTLSSNGLWKYVSVRRLFIFLERSIYEGTQWVVFEPNDPRLWARVTDTVTLFLRTQWRQGALFGRTEEQAFFVKCDESTMTQDDIMNGRLICEIGIAPVRPAEFVVFRIFQNTADTPR
jgi:phage tail sheath protein FI